MNKVIMQGLVIILLLLLLSVFDRNRILLWLIPIIWLALLYIPILKKYQIAIKNNIATIMLTPILFYIIFPGVLMHVQQKALANDLRSTVLHLKNESHERNIVYIWHAAAFHNCGVNEAHNFQMSEVFRYYQLNNVRFVKPPNAKIDECLAGDKGFKEWQTRFYPQSLSRYSSREKQLPDFILVRGDSLAVVRKILVDKEMSYEIVYESNSYSYWNSLRKIARRISKWSFTEPWYVLLKRQSD